MTKKQQEDQACQSTALFALHFGHEALVFAHHMLLRRGRWVAVRQGRLLLLLLLLLFF